MTVSPSHPVTKARLSTLTQMLSQGKVLVVGDLAIDEMIYGNTDRLSREAPVVILKHNRTDIILGGGGNAVHNIAAYGVERAPVLAVCGKDYYATLLMEALERDGIDTSGVIFDEDRPTTTKTRISGMVNQSVTQQVVRIDRESRTPVSSAIEFQLIQKLNELAPSMDAILISDYNLGVVTDTVIAEIHKLQAKYGLIVTVDSQRALSKFPGATLMTPNQPEAEANLGQPFVSWLSWLEGGCKLCQQAQCKNLLITRGQDGMLLFDQSQHYTTIPAFNRSEVFDVTGAGDTVIATMTLAMSVGASVLEAALLGNLAASIVVKRFGASVTSVTELLEAIEQMDETVLSAIHPQSLAQALEMNINLANP